MASLPVLCVLLPVLLPSALAVIGSRTEQVGVALVNFTWSRADRHSRSNYSAAAAFCRRLYPKARLPAATELRFFFKTLPANPRAAFYLADVLEATTDYPDPRMGERLCLVVSKSDRGVTLLRDDARTSCSKVATLIVCRHEAMQFAASTSSSPSNGANGVPGLSTPAPGWSRAVGDVCLDPDLFYGILSSAGAILILLTLLCATLAVYGWRQSRANAAAAAAEAHAMGTLSRSSSKRSSYRGGAPGPAIMAADYLSRHQAAAIGSHLQREPSTKMAQASMLL